MVHYKYNCSELHLIHVPISVILLKGTECENDGDDDDDCDQNDDIDDDVVDG